jgi:predicted Zn-dependent peptidase
LKAYLLENRNINSSESFIDIVNAATPKDIHNFIKEYVKDVNLIDMYFKSKDMNQTSVPKSENVGSH